MKTKLIVEYFTKLGIETKVVNKEKGVLELPSLPGLLVAVSETRDKQLAAIESLRDLSSKSGCTIASCVQLDDPFGSTVVAGIGRVPVFTVLSGRLEDTHATGGHKVINNRAGVILEEYAARPAKSTRWKSPYLSWLCKAIGVSRPKTLGEFQDLMIEANAAPGSEVLPALSELALGRGSSAAVLAINSDVQFNDAEPAVCESSYCFYDIERLSAGMTSAQAHVINKMTSIFKQCVDSKQVTKTIAEPKATRQMTATAQALELMSV